MNKNADRASRCGEYDPSQSCRGCRYHAAEDAAHIGHGECRAGLPDRAYAVGRTHSYTYRLTANDLPACGLFRPRAARPVAARVADPVLDAIEAAAPAVPVANDSRAEHLLPELIS